MGETMTVLDTRLTAAVPTVDVTWASPDNGLWVATINGDYAGMVEFADGHFVVSDHTGTVLTTTSSIPDAQSALSTHGTLTLCA